MSRMSVAELKRALNRIELGDASVEDVFRLERALVAVDSVDDIKAMQRSWVLMLGQGELESGQSSLAAIASDDRRVLVAKAIVLTVALRAEAIPYTTQAAKLYRDAVQLLSNLNSEPSATMRARAKHYNDLVLKGAALSADDDQGKMEYTEQVFKRLRNTRNYFPFVDFTAMSYLDYYDGSPLDSDNHVVAMLYLGESNLVQANFSGLDLSDLKMEDSYALGANFRNACFGHYSRISGSSLRDACFAGAKLESMTIANIDAQRANWSGVVIANTIIKQSDCAYANFSGSRLNNVTLSHVSFAGADLTDAVWTKVSCDHVTFTKAKFSYDLAARLIKQHALELADIDWSVQPDALRSRRGELVELAQRVSIAQQIKAKAFDGELFNWSEQAESVQHCRGPLRALAGLTEYDDGDAVLEQFVNGASRRELDEGIKQLSRNALLSLQSPSSLIGADYFNRLRLPRLCLDDMAFDGRPVTFNLCKLSDGTARNVRVKRGSAMQGCVLERVQLSIAVDYRGSEIVHSDRKQPVWHDYGFRLSGINSANRAKVSDSIIGGEFCYDQTHIRSFSSFYVDYHKTKLNGDFAYAGFGGCLFNECTMAGDFSQADFRGPVVNIQPEGPSDWYGEDVKGVAACELVGCTLQADFRGADFAGVKLHGCVFDGAQIGINPSLARADIDGCVVTAGSHKAMVGLIVSGVDIEHAVNWGHKSSIGDREGYIAFKRTMDYARSLIADVAQLRKFDRYLVAEAFASDNVHDLVERCATMAQQHYNKPLGMSHLWHHRSASAFSEMRKLPARMPRDAEPAAAAYAR